MPTGNHQSGSAAPRSPRWHRLAAALLALFGRTSGWRNATTAPCNQEVELRVREGRLARRLPYPCLQDNAGRWLNVDLGTVVAVEPVQWRPWAWRPSPEPHHDAGRLVRPRRPGPPGATFRAKDGIDGLGQPF